MKQKKRPAAHHAPQHVPALERVVLLVVLLGLWSLYPVLNRPWGSLHSFASSLDSFLPFVPAFIIPYLFFFFPAVLIFLFWTFFRRPRVFLSFVFALLAGLLISYSLYISVQSVVIRPVPEGEGLTSIVRWVYHADARYNAFPSTHTVTTIILLLTLLPLLSRRSLQALAILVAASVITSTLLLRQHYVLDVLLGMGVGWISWRLGLAMSHEILERGPSTTAPTRGAGGRQAATPRKRRRSRKPSGPGSAATSARA